MIRPATTADLPAIAACVEDAYATYIPRMGKRPAPMDADHAARIASTWVLTGPDAGPDVAGLIVLIPDGGDLMIENVAVSPRHQGHGYGRRLMDFAEDQARERGAPALTLYTNEKMTENLALYARLGFHETGRRTEDGFARVYMVKTLT